MSEIQCPDITASHETPERSHVYSLPKLLFTDCVHSYMCLMKA
ncbi:unnamed protein product [Chondrus crispus]|uniref:Uncharacterized protein n=1 Tax=Chondrus crispus TaxID=2769 RepID=R7QI86_CHOCR|nr:unnamed protein product [Chondrus crispus]CDF37463.1 unnamed protein product [Chondrus crispus]|eukprot:XP_005717282.1 unnamed protein product [Chondrus crispus]